MQSTLSYIFGIVLMLLGIAISIAWHELGHLIPAKKFGARVPKYMVGFGPTLFSRKKGETEYGIKAIPLGGYITISGMFPPGKDREPKTFLGRWVRDARAQQREIDGEFDESRSFYRLSVPKRIVVMMGGPVMNLILGFALILSALSLVGVQQPSLKLSGVQSCVPADYKLAKCGADATISPAQAAGIRANDRITSVDGLKVSTWLELDTVLQATTNQTIAITVDRAGESVTLQVQPITYDRPVWDASNGKYAQNADGSLVLAPRRLLGVVLSDERAPLPLAASATEASNILGKTFALVIELPKQLLAVGESAALGTPRSENAPVSLVGVGQIAGQVASNDDLSFESKVVSGLMMLGSLNFALFVFNLIPLLPLDGGHVLSAIYEGIKRNAFKLFARRDPGPVDTAMAVPFTMLMWVALMAMSVLIIAADIVNPISFG